MKNVKSRIKALFILVFAAIALTLGSCSLDHGPVDSSKLDTYKVVFIFNDAAGTVVSTKEIEVVKGETLLVSQIPQIRDQLKADGYGIPSSYEVYWVLLNDLKEPIDLDPEAEVNNLLNITEAICDNEGKVYVQVAYKQFGGTVSFISNGGTAVEPIVEVEVGQTLQGKQPADPTRVGYTFLGWYDKTLTSLFDWNTVLTEEAIELYAKWEANDDTAYAVEHYFEALDGTYKLESSEKLAGTTEELVEAEALVKEGFTHNEKHPEALEEAQIAADGSLVLKVYYSRNSYTVTFDAAGGEEKEAQTYKYGQTLNLGVAAKTGYTFLGWTLEGEAFAELSMPAKNLELVATWTSNKNTAYKVEHYFEALDGSYAKDAKVESLFGETGSEVEAVVRTVTGFEHNAEHKDALESATILADGSLVLRVYYSRNSYTLTVDVDGVKEVVEYKYQEEVAAPSAPEKVGYTFSSWSAAIPTTMPATDIEVVALWTINQYTLTINVDGVKQTVKYNYQAEVAAPAAPEKVGYTFTGWTPAVPATMPAEDVEVVAEWTINQYTLTINVDGVKQEVEYDYLEEIAAVAAPEKAGYTFTGWMPEIPATMPAEDVEVVATWEIVEYSISYNTNEGILRNYASYEEAVADFLKDYNAARGTSHTVESFSSLGSWGEIGAASLFLYNANYRAKWAWLVDYIASVAGSANKKAWEKFNDYDSQAGFNAANGNYIYSIAYELRGWVGQIKYTKNANYHTADYSTEEVKAKFMACLADSKYTVESEDIELLQPIKADHIFLGWFDNSEFNGNAIAKIEKGSTGNLELHAKWIHVVDNAKNLAQKALAEYILTDEIVKASKYEENYDEFAAELEVQKGLIAAATSVEGVEKALDAAKKALLIIVEPVAPTSITVSATTNKVMLGASLALQLAFEGPEGYQTLVSYASANEEIATVENGIVKFIAEGNVVITVSSMIDPLIKGTIEFTVVAADVTNIVVAADAVENACVLYNENHYFYGVNLFNNLKDAISSSKNDSVINILDGKYTLGSVINKSLTFVGQSVEGVEITVTANVSSNVAASNIRFESVTLRGSAAATSAGVYFQPSSKAYNLTFNNCHITRMNTFYKGTISTTNPVVLTVQNCDIDNIGQFFVWVTAGLEKVNFISNNVDASTCGGVSNSAAALLRIRIGSAFVYDNHFTGDTQNIDGLFESGVSATLVDVRFNVFENVTKYVHINGGKPVQFDKNLYLDSKGQVLNSVPATVTGAGVTAGSALADEETRKYEYAYFKAPSKSLTLNLNEGTLVDAPTFYKVGFGLVLPTPTRTDYTFTGWFDNAECTGAPITEITKDDNNDIVLYAGWMTNVISSNLSYELNGGTAEGLPIEYIEGVATALPNATKDGYTFLGWFLNADLTGDALTEIPTTATGDLKLYAGFEAIDYTIEYDLDAGSFNEYPVKYATKSDLVADFMSDYNKLYGTSYTKPEETHSARTTNFWKNAEMYAKWKWMLEYFCDLAAEQGFGSNTSYYTNMYNGGNGIGTVSGYVTQSVTTYLLGINGTIWNEQYKETYGSLSSKATTLDFTAESGNEYQEYMIFAPRTYNADLEVTLMEPTREGYTFLGWYDNEEFAGEKVTVIAKGTLGNKKYYASWEETLYTIEYVLNEGVLFGEYADLAAIKADFNADYKATTGYNDYSHWYGSTSAIMNVFTKTNHKWDWLLDYWTVTNANSYSGVANATVFQQVKTSGTCSDYYYLSTEIAGWYLGAQKAVYSGSLKSADYADANVNELIWNYAPKKSTYKMSMSEDYNLVSPYRENYVFLGWYDNEGFAGEPITKIAAGSIGNVTLYAKWELELANANVTYTVNFSSKAELLDAFLYDFYQFLIEKGTITNEVTFDAFSGRNNKYLGSWFAYQQYGDDMTVGDLYFAAGLSYSANHLILTSSDGILVANEEYFFNSTKYGAKWRGLADWINSKVGTSKRFFNSIYGGCELQRWIAEDTTNYGSFDKTSFLDTLTWTVNYTTESSSTMPTMYKHGLTFKGWMDASSNLHTVLPVADPVELDLTPSWQ